MNCRNAFALIALLTVSCSSDDDLDGTWYFRSEENGVVSYYAPHIIVQDGDRVVLRDCRGYANEFTLDGGLLYRADGSYYYLRVVDTETMNGFGEGGVSTLVKLSSHTRFTRGSLHLASPAIANLSADEDVCAMTSPGLFEGAGGVERVVTTVAISAPYGRSYLRLDMAFQEFAPGVHPLVVEFEDFVVGSGPGILASIESAEFQPPVGYESLAIVGGTIQVTDVRPTSFAFHGTLQLSSGEPLTVSAQVDLTAPPASRE